VADQFVRDLVADPLALDLTPTDRAMIDYALALTRAPHSIATESVAALRAAGFDDRGIHDICLVTAYYAFVNRVADGLGVELEDRFNPG
jgi:uncharacterized peroxidase-related enzyme